MSGEVSRRTFGKIGLLSGLVQFFPKTALAQASLDIGSLSERIVKLEKVANDLKLPIPNANRAPVGGVLKQSNYYQVGMPRLAELIERSNGNSTAVELSSETGSLLSELHRMEYSTSYTEGGTRAPAPSPDSLKPSYLRLYNECEINQSKQSIVAWHMNFIVSHRNRYEEAIKGSPIPWYFAGIVHSLEASFNFLAHLHNGDYPLSQVTTHVPKGRPQPWESPYTWEKSAQDAFKLQGLWSKPAWPLELVLYRLEAYNGFGYYSKKINSPYLWCYSNQYKKGKFAADHTYNPNLVSQQCGGAVILKALAASHIIQL